MEQLQVLWNQLINSGVELGKHILAAICIYFIGQFLIRMLNRGMQKMMNRRTLDPEIRSFFGSAVSISLNVLLIVAIIGALGIETTSFAALIASFGVAAGMALSGQMQNLASGILILIQRPYHIGDYVIFSEGEGVVVGIQIFTTKLRTPDNKVVTVPNGIIASGTVTNVTAEKTRRIDFEIGVEYDTNFDTVRTALMEIAKNDADVLDDPAPQVMLSELADSSVNAKLRVWVPSDKYWDVYFRINETVYKTFNEKGIGFPFPQLTIHQAK